MVQLADNAVTHTHDGDEIHFGSALSRRPGVVVDHRPRTRLRPDDARVFFDRFTRGSGARRGQRGGAGLGLAIVRAIAEAHHGEAKLVSPPGQGATFGIELPAHRGGVM